MKIIAAGIRPVAMVVVLAWPSLAASQVASGTPPANPPPSASPPAAGQQRTADFQGEDASRDSRRVADWVMASGDNAGLPFVIIDKMRTKVFVFGRDGRLRGATLALLGMARGDDSAPGIGDRKLSAIRPEERTTPAGRFVAVLGRDLKHDILWIDYGLSLSLHRVITGNPGDHRLQRLATTSTLDKRISYGCVNVPVKFYEEIVLGNFTGTTGIVYILPEVKTIQEVFSMASGAGVASLPTR